MARRQLFSDRPTNRTDWPRVAKLLIVLGMIVAMVSCVAWIGRVAG